MKKIIVLALAFMVLSTSAFASEKIIPIVLAEQTAWINTIATSVGITQAKALQIMTWLDGKMTKNIVEKKTTLDENGDPVSTAYFLTVWSPLLHITVTQITTIELDREIAVLQDELAAKQAELEAKIAERQAVKAQIPDAEEIEE